MSDYFEGVQMNVIEGFAKCIFTRIRGDSDVDYPKEVVEHLTSEGFLERNQPLYLGRCRRLGLDARRNVDITESYRRLVEKGLTENDPRLRIGWFDGRTQNPGTSSTLMKVVQIARALDDEKVSDNARDYALYQNIAHIDMGFNPRTGNGNRKKEFETRLDRYPGREDVENELMRLGFRVRSLENTGGHTAPETTWRSEDMEKDERKNETAHSYFTVDGIRNSMRKIPIGIQDFKEVRDKDYYYVDKSDLIAQILDTGAKVYLFTRPRRFGKSLNLSMLDAFLNMKHKGNTWFDGLRISERKDLEPRKNSSPVIYFDFKDLNVSTFDSFLEGMANKIADLYRLNADVLEDITDIKLKEDVLSIRRGKSAVDTLSRSIRILTDIMRDHYGKKAIVLIDEYDNPAQNAYGTVDFRKIMDFMKVMLGSVLKGNESLDFAVMTGVMQISKESIFSGLNNLAVNNILSKRSDELFGFTPDEVRKMCEDYGHPEKYEEAKEWYDGYVFGDAEIYNPWSVLNYVDSGFEPFPFWAGTSGNSIIRDLMSRTDYATAENLRTLASGGSIIERVDPTIVYGDLDSDPTSIYSMMAMAGYLKAIPKGSYYELSIPNREMFGVFADMMSQSIIKGSSSLFKFADSIVRCDTRILSSSLYEMMSDAVGFRVLDNEHSYQAFITGVLMYLSGRYEVTADMEAGNGYYDIRLKSRRGDGPNILIEIKRRRDSDGNRRIEALADEALAQIKGKDYIHGLKGDTILYGVAFDGKLPSVIAERIVL